VIDYMGVAKAKQVHKLLKFSNPGGSPTTTFDPAPSNILIIAPAFVEEACKGILIVELSLFGASL
jgi:hypothetical protein